jgi:RNA polymerase sigma-70 factor, ECF subfamily
LESDGRDDLTSLLEGARSGQSGAQNRLFEAVYKYLHGLAVGLMQGERTDHTLQPSALVNEAVLRLVQSQAIDRVEDRRCLFVVAAHTMRQVLVDHARNRGAAKRLGDWKRVPLGACPRIN